MKFIKIFTRTNLQEKMAMKDTELETKLLQFKEDCLVRHNIHTCINFSKFYSHEFLKF